MSVSLCALYQQNLSRIYAAERCRKLLIGLQEYDNTYTTIRATIAFDSIWIAFSIIGAGVALVVSRKQKHRSNDRSWLLVILLGLFGFLL